MLCSIYKVPLYAVGTFYNLNGGFLPKTGMCFMQMYADPTSARTKITTCHGSKTAAAINKVPYRRTESTNRSWASWSCP